MHVHHLGPHSFISEEPHSRHHAWLKSFTPEQRRQMIDEDIHARMEASGIMAGVMVLGIVIAVVVVPGRTLMLRHGPDFGCHGWLVHPCSRHCCRKRFSERATAYRSRPLA